MDNPLIAATALVIALCGGAAYLAHKDARDWAAFAAEHHCAKIGETSGSVSTGYAIGANGQGGFITTYTAGKTGWKCNDGVTYWR